MAEFSMPEIRILPDAERVGRYRWAIMEGWEAVQKSERTYPTKREARLAADDHIDSLILIWQKHN